MPSLETATDAELEAKILELLDENRVMTVATNRADGWPQATLVGYVREGLDLYFAVGRQSQKLANIARDPRVSIAIGRVSVSIGKLDPDRILGLSMAAHAAEVDDPAEIERLNTLVESRYPEVAVFAPREAAVAVVRARPELISIVDLPMAPGAPTLVEVTAGTGVRRVVAGAGLRSRP